MTQPESGSSLGFGPGWDRRDQWTLRFIDPYLEQSYLAAMAGPGRQRFRIACSFGIVIWILVGALGSPLLGVPAAPLLMVVLVNCVWEALAVGLTFRPITLHQVWALAFTTSALCGPAIVIAFSVGGSFVEVGALALMTVGVFAMGLVRIAAWVAAALGLFQVVLFFVVTLALGTGGVGLFQGFLLIGTMTVAVIGCWYLEATERTAFAQATLVADLHRRIDHLFRQYLSPDVAQALVDDPGRAELGGEVAEVSVLFADLRGYTPFSERTSPAEVVVMLNASFGAAVPAVFAEGGTIVQFVGDALMAIFNAPLRQPDHALRACRAGLALQRSVSGIGGDADRPRFRVGINTGPALVGNIGSAELRNFSALGDTTNVAARLEAYAQPGSVVIGEHTYELVRDMVEVRALGAPDLKGKSVPTEAYELVAIVGADPAGPAAPRATIGTAFGAG